MQSRLNGASAVAIAGLVVVFAVVASPASAQPRWGRPRAPRAGACFYRDAGYRGDYFCVDAAARTGAATRNERSDSSIQVFGDVEVEVYQDTSFRGRSRRFDRSVRNLGDDGWNDRLSSDRVNRPRDRERGRYRATATIGDGRDEAMTRSRAEDIVRRAYESVLRREPDPGSRGFVDRVMNERWTQADVEKELRNSEEYRRMKR